ncbi:2-isopropylmalate synthase [Bacillus sp. 165]|uniref:2-isopropylmalate synthase n=1 Tax=Bacillus sp. 165 TaxID=1529117 RepID=UPI001ADC2ACA|nr:2-isopropylmalate synthase [Bacillus sp. 165]MBO9128406.1 2-isopropylmalate synthase [Bacillus sp. 165]
MDYDSHNDYNEEYSGEISPGYRQDARHDEGHRFSPFLLGLAIAVTVLLLIIVFVYM